jgi:hypothetical protein
MAGAVARARTIGVLHQVEPAVPGPVAGGDARRVIRPAEQPLLPSVPVPAGIRGAAAVGQARLVLAAVTPVRVEGLGHGAAVCEQPVGVEIERHARVVAYKGGEFLDVVLEVGGGAHGGGGDA